MPETRCPCCRSPECRLEAAPFEHGQCLGCGHRWRTALHRPDYAALAGRTVADAGDLARRLAERLAFIGRVPAGSTVLEVGCAEGHLGRALRARAPGVKLVGVEPSPDAAAARGHFDAVHQASFAAALLDGRSFERVLCFHVLEHLPDPLAACLDFRGATSAGGRVVIEVPNGSGHTLLSWDRNPEHLQFFSVGSLACVLARAGLEPSRLQTGGFESPPYADCLRVEARPTVAASERAAAWPRRLAARLKPGDVVWGAGGDFENYVRPWLAALAPAFIVDSDRARQGSPVDGVAVRDPSALAGLPTARVLVASYRFEAQILASLVALGIDPARAVTLRELLALEGAG